MQILDYLRARAEEEAPAVDPDEATAADYESALAELGVNVDEENTTE